MSKHHPTGLNYIRPGKWAALFVKQCKSMGMTDAEIKLEMEKIQRQNERDRSEALAVTANEGGDGGEE